MIEEASIDSPVLSHSWVLRSDEVGEKLLYVSVHHGDNSGNDAGSPFFGVSQAFEITVEAIPDNLQRIDPEYQPPTSREVGQSTTLCLETIAASDVVIEWREPSGESYQVETTENDQCWSAVLPPALTASTIEWRAILDGEGPQQTTPWFSLTSAEPTWEADESALMLQSIAHLVLFFGLVLLVRKPKRSSDEFKHYVEETI